MNPEAQEKGERVRGVLMDQEDACFCLLFFFFSFAGRAFSIMGLWI